MLLSRLTGTIYYKMVVPRKSNVVIGILNVLLCCLVGRWGMHSGHITYKKCFVTYQLTGGSLLKPSIALLLNYTYFCLEISLIGSVPA